MLGTFVAGRYSAAITYPTEQAKSLGLTESGYSLSWRTSKDLISRTDAYGITTIEGFNVGTNMNLQCVCREWIEGVIQSMNPSNGWNGGANGVFSLGTISEADTEIAGSLLLSATAGTPAATAPATLTAALCIQESDATQQVVFDSFHRLMPLSFRVYPYAYESTIRFFTSQ